MLYLVTLTTNVLRFFSRSSWRRRVYLSISMFLIPSNIMWYFIAYQFQRLNLLYNSMYYCFSDVSFNLCDVLINYCYEIFIYCDVFINYCYIFINYCDVLLHFCEVFISQCDVFVNSCDFFFTYCDVFINYCNLFINNCGVSLNFCDMFINY